MSLPNPAPSHSLSDHTGGSFSRRLCAPWFIALLAKSFLLLACMFVSVGLVRADGVQEMNSTLLDAPPFVAFGGSIVSAQDGLLAPGIAADDSPQLWFKDQRTGSWTSTGIAVGNKDQLLAWENGLIVMGGTPTDAGTFSVSRVRRTAGGWTAEELPALKVNGSGVAAAVVGNTLFAVAMGAQSAGTPESTNFFALDLRKPGSWTSQSPLPGGIPVDGFATAQYGMFCFFTRVSGENTLSTWLYRPQPLEGTAEKGWRAGASVPDQTLTSALAVPVGQAQVVLIPTGSIQHAPLLYNTVTDAWSSFAARMPFAVDAAGRAGERIMVLGTESGGASAAAGLAMVRTVRNLAWIDYAVIAAYFVLLTGIGLYFSKQESSLEFSLGNRSVRWWAAGISMFATGASAISFMAIPALAFATNLVWLFFFFVFIPGYFVTAYLIFPLLRRMEITSTYEYLERRFNRTLRIIASLQCILFQTVAKASVVLVLPALAISSVTGINVYTSVIIMGVITTVYTAIGGFEAVIWTEVFQAALMLLAPLAIIVVALGALPGGPGDFISIGMELHKFDFALVTWDVAVPAFWILMTMQFVTVTVSVAGDQPIIQRVFSAPLKEVRKVNAMSTTCGIVIGIMVNLMGLAIFAYFHTHPWKFDPMAQNDQIVPMFVVQAMPVGVAGMVIAAIFAASMSTVASVMNSVATIFTEDFYMRFRPAANDRQRLVCLKISSYVVGILGTCTALFLAALDLKSMMVVWMQLAALLGGGIVGVYTLGMFTRRANGFGAIGGALASIAVTSLVKAYTSLHWGTYLPIAIFTCIGFGYLLSFLRPARKELAGLTVFTPARPETDG
jgi:solute:Na+ symporter, SSS family